MVKEIRIAGRSRDSAVLVGETLECASRYIPSGRGVILTDSNVHHRHGSRFPAFPMIQIDPGEEAKNLRTVESVYERLIQLKADRSTFLLGIGGGVVCDIAGFAASTYMRGIRFGYVPTTLLAQVDAAVGGKNGVNFGRYKNMVGLFNQPEFVVCDISFVQTLPRKEISCGFAEIIKHAAIADADMLSFLEAQADEALALDAAVLEALVHRSVTIKAAVVGRDETEQGERRKLNFGHTFGHAVERSAGISHGEAVSIGMAIAADISVQRGLLTEEERTRLIGILKRYRLPVSIEAAKDRLWDALQQDKKRDAGKIHFVLLNGLGNAVVETLGLEAVKGYMISGFRF